MPRKHTKTYQNRRKKKVVTNFKLSSSTLVSLLRPSTDHTMSDTSLPDELLKLSNLLEDSLETLSSGNGEICDAALSATKHIFDLCMWFKSHS